MKVKAVKGMECPSCGEVILYDDLPKVNGKLALDTMYMCGECEVAYVDEAEAATCCKE